MLGKSRSAYTLIVRTVPSKVYPMARLLQIVLQRLPASNKQDGNHAANIIPIGDRKSSCCKAPAWQLQCKLASHVCAEGKEKEGSRYDSIRLGQKAIKVFVH